MLRERGIDDPFLYGLSPWFGYLSGRFCGEWFFCCGLVLSIFLDAPYLKRFAVRRRETARAEFRSTCADRRTSCEEP